MKLKCFFALLALFIPACPAGGDGAGQIRDMLRRSVPRELRSTRRFFYRELDGIKRLTDIEDAAEAAGEVFIAYRNRVYFNYDFFLRSAGVPGEPAPGPADFLLEPGARDPGFALHPGLLDAMYAENIRLVFFTAEVPPYFPSRQYRRVPWLAEGIFFYFGRAFWDDSLVMARLYRRIYGSAASDFNSQVRRAWMYRRMDEKPEAIVLALMKRTGANEQWKNAWGEIYYYYFEGWHVHVPG